MNYPAPNISGNIFNLINRKITSNISHNNLSNINEGNVYKHLTSDQMNKIDNYVSLTNDGIISKEQWYDITRVKNNILLLNNPFTGLIYGQNDGYFIQNENLNGFIIKSSNDQSIIGINSNPENLLDLTTKLYVDNKISNIQYNHSDIILNNTNLLLKVSQLNNNVLNLLNGSSGDNINIGNSIESIKLYIDSKISNIQLINSEVTLHNTELLNKITELNINVLNLINEIKNNL